MATSTQKREKDKRQREPTGSHKKTPAKSPRQPRRTPRKATAKRTLAATLIALGLAGLTYFVWNISVYFKSHNVAGVEFGAQTGGDTNGAAVPGATVAEPAQPTTPQTQRPAPRSKGKAAPRVRQQAAPTREAIASGPVPNLSDVADDAAAAVPGAITDPLPAEIPAEAVAPAPGAVPQLGQPPRPERPDRPDQGGHSDESLARSSNSISIYVPVEDLSEEVTAETRDSQIRLADGLSRIGVLAATLEAADAVLRCECETDGPAVLWTLIARVNGITIWQKLVMTDGVFMAKDVAHSVFLDLKDQMTQIETELSETGHDLL